MVGVVFPDTEKLETEIPIFPLPDALLLPGGRLPLNIFEPRYLHMIVDALGHGRLIGMIQPKPKEDLDLRDHVDVFATGCAGRIVNFSETEDGRFVITLLGVSRFNITRELPLRHGYRVIEADYLPFVQDIEEPPAFVIDRDRFLRAARTFFDARGLSTDWSSLDGAADIVLVTSLAMACPFDSREKQALLECTSLAERGELMINLMEMGSRSFGTAPTPAAH